MTITKSIGLTAVKFPSIVIRKMAIKKGIVGLKVLRVGGQRGIHKDDEKDLVDMMVYLIEADARPRWRNRSMCYCQFNAQG